MVKAVPLELWCQLVSIMYIQQLQKVLHATLSSTHWNTNRPSMFFCRRYIRKFWRRTGIVCDVQCWSMTTQKWNSLILFHHQVHCVFLFLCAASLFGTIIAQVNEIVADLTTKKKDLDRVLEAYLTLTPRLSFQPIFATTDQTIQGLGRSYLLMMHDFFRVDTNTMFSIRKWERFQFMIEYEAQQVWPCCFYVQNCALNFSICCDVMCKSSTKIFLRERFQMLWSYQ